MKGQVYKLRALLSQLASQLVYKFNDWINLIKDKLIQLTKAGKLWRCGKNAYRLDWEKAIGKVFYIHNKPCLLLKRFKEEGEWYLTYFDGQDIITETQNQAKYRKNISKKAIIEKPQDKIAVPTITYQLCLPAPISILDKLFNEAKEIGVLVYQVCVGGTWEEWNEEYRVPEYTEEEAKIAYIAFIYKNRGEVNRLDSLTTAYKDLCKVYHPDVNATNTTKIFQHIIACFK